MNLVYDSNYSYFLHGTNIDNISAIDEVFNSGIISYKGNVITFVASLILEEELEKNNIFTIMDEYTKQGFKLVYLIKIHNRYLGLLPNRPPCTPIPVWKTDMTSSHNDNQISWLTPRLIVGVYNPFDNCFYDNNNYNPLFIPNGLQYSREQIEIFAATKQNTLVEFAKMRSLFPYETLYRSDAEKGEWEKTMQNYVKIINTFENKINK